MKTVNAVLRFLLYKILRLRAHENNIGVHFYLPLKQFLVCRIDLAVVRLSVFFPFFVSVSVGVLTQDVDGPPASVYQIYGGFKQDGHQTHLLGEPDYLLSVAARRIDVPARVAYTSVAAF
jgi:hypothetical protein